MSHCTHRIVVAATGARFSFTVIAHALFLRAVQRRLQKDGGDAREFQLLRYFIEHRGTALSREAILNNVWGYDAMPSTRTIDTHVTWLRQKLEENPKFPKYILTVHGLGYKFVGRTASLENREQSRGRRKRNALGTHRVYVTAASAWEIELVLSRERDERVPENL